MRTIRDDVRMAIRRLRQQPGFAAVAVATLALGLGANIAIFSLLHALLLRTLPVERPGELYRLGDNNNCCVNSGLQTDWSLFSYRLFEHLRAEVPGFTGLAGFQANTLPIGVRRAGDRVATSIPSQYVTANYFEVFGVTPASGRLLRPDDDRADAPPVVVLSHRTWSRLFGEGPAVAGSTVIVNGRPMTVAGIANREFFGDTVRPDPTGIWIPIGQEQAIRGAASLVDRQEQHWLYAIGRAGGDVPPAAMAAAATRAVQAWLTATGAITDQNRESLPRQTIAVAPAGGGVALMRVSFLQPLTVLALTSGLVLLIACANLANLLLARADRAQAAIRAALGASGRRLMRQAMVEGIVLALAGGLAGLFVAAAGTRVLVALVFPGAAFVPIDVTPPPLVLAFGLGLAVLTGALFSAAPAWAMSRVQALDALHGVGRSGHERSFVPRRSLVIVQVALSLVLLAGAGLLGRSLSNLETQPLGFVAEDRTVVRVELPAIAGQTERLAALYEKLQSRLLAIPGVVNASYVLYAPMEGNNYQMQISVDGRPADPAQPDSSPWNRVGPRYFETSGTRVLRGRAIDERDTPGAARVAVVSEAFVKRYFDGQDPIGRRLGLGDASHAADFEIVGVVEDVKYTGANRPVRPMIFFPALQSAVYAPGFVQTSLIRSTLARVLILHTRPGMNVEGDLRSALADIDADITVLRVMPLVDQVLGNFRLDRLKARLLTAYGALALVLAALGLYGVTAYGVARRRREIGIRMALGAGRTQILHTVMKGPVAQTAIGIAVGLPLAAFASRAVAADLYGVNATNPFVFASAVGILLASAAGAAVIPAVRATAVDPTQALR